MMATPITEVSIQEWQLKRRKEAGKIIGAMITVLLEDTRLMREEMDRQPLSHRNTLEEVSWGLAKLRLIIADVTSHLLILKEAWREYEENSTEEQFRQEDVKHRERSTMVTNEEWRARLGGTIRLLRTREAEYVTLEANQRLNYAVAGVVEMSSCDRLKMMQEEQMKMSALVQELGGKIENMLRQNGQPLVDAGTGPQGEQQPPRQPGPGLQGQQQPPLQAGTGSQGQQQPPRQAGTGPQGQQQQPPCKAGPGPQGQQQQPRRQAGPVPQGQQQPPRQAGPGHHGQQQQPPRQAGTVHQGQQQPPRQAGTVHQGQQQPPRQAGPGLQKQQNQQLQEFHRTHHHDEHPERHGDQLQRHQHQQHRGNRPERSPPLENTGMRRADDDYYSNEEDIRRPDDYRRPREDVARRDSSGSLSRERRRFEELPREIRELMTQFHRDFIKDWIRLNPQAGIYKTLVHLTTSVFQQFESLGQVGRAPAVDPRHPCIFCGQDHWSEACHQVIEQGERLDQAMRDNRCLSCLRVGPHPCPRHLCYQCSRSEGNIVGLDFSESIDDTHHAAFCPLVVHRTRMYELREVLRREIRQRQNY